MRLLAQREVRLVTLTGPGGVGKTRLSLEVAREAAGRFPSGLVYVPLATVADPALVLPAIAKAAGVEDGDATSLFDRLVMALSGERLLLVLDNLEQVASAAITLADLLRAVPTLTALVTSRIALRISGEHEYAVAPLGIPETGHSPFEVLEENEAIAFFVRRAQAVNGRFALTPQNAPAIAEICRRLDGLPLALELAAARIKVLSPQALLARLGNQLQVLTGGSVDLPARQQTMRNAIAWSYDLLTPEQQMLFRRLAVFRASFTLEAAEAVAGGEGESGEGGKDESALPAHPLTPFPATLDTVSLLVDHSLLVREDPESNEPRFRMLWTVREFALEQLEANGEADAVRLAGAAYWRGVAEQSWNGVGSLDSLQSALDQLEADHDNVRSSLDWLEKHDHAEALRLAGALFWFWYVRGHHGEALRRLERLIWASDDRPASQELARALLTAGVFAHFQGRTEQAVVWLEDALGRCRQHADIWGTGFALFALGLIAEDAGGYDHAATLLDEAILLLTRAGDFASAGSARYHLAVVAFGRGDLEAAGRLLSALLDHSSGPRIRVAAWAIHLRGLVAHARGEFESALRDFQESLRRFQAAHYLAEIDEALAGLAVVAMSYGNPVASARLGTAAQRQAEERGDSFQMPEREVYEAALAETRQSLGAESYESERAIGLAWSTAEAIEAGLALTPAPVPTKSEQRRYTRPQSTSRLSGREIEVLRLVAEGLSNDQVAERLFLSPRTIHAHLTTIYRKLGVSNRSEATRYAFENGIT